MVDTSRSFPGRGHVYDVAIVGAGLCGTEAALACARANLDTLLVTTSLDTLYNLYGEGAVLDSELGTLLHNLTAEVADEKGWVDTWALHRAAKYVLEHTPGLHLLQSSASSLVVENNSVAGITTWEGVPRLAKRTALCVGSFLEARLHIGTLTEKAGRLSEMAYDDLYEDLLRSGFEFEPLQVKATFEDESLPYSVDCKIFSKSERDGFKLPRLAGLYAAGLCVSGELSYEEHASQGRQLAEVLVKLDP